MCTVLLPSGGNPIAVNKYIIIHNYGLEDRGIALLFPERVRCLSSSKHPDRMCGPMQPSNQWVPDTSLGTTEAGA